MVRASALSSPAESREALRRREARSRPSPRAFGAPAPTPRVAIGALDGRGGARRVAARAAEGQVEQLERQVREDPVTPAAPSAGDADASDDSDRASSRNPGENPRGPSNDRVPLGPGRRFLLKAKLYFLLAASWTVRWSCPRQTAR